MCGRGAFPARIGVGEMLADVACADGAQQSVGQRVQRDVGVGVAFQRVGVGDSDAAQPDVVARRPAGARRSPVPLARRGSRAARSAMARSSAVVSLRLAALPMTSATGRPAHSATAASSVMSSLPAAAARCVRGQDLGEAEPLRGLRAPQPGALERGGDAVVGPGLLEGVGQGDGGDGARRWASAVSTRSMISGVTNGRAASWISTRSGACGPAPQGHCGRRPAASLRPRRGQAACRPEARQSHCVEGLIAGARSRPAPGRCRVIQECAERAGQHRDRRRCARIASAADRRPACLGRQRRSARQSSSHAPP